MTASPAPAGATRQATARSNITPPLPVTLAPSEVQMMSDGNVHTLSGLAGLRLQAEMLSDLMQERISVENRIRSEAIDSPAVESLLSGLMMLERGLKLALAKEYRVAAPPGVVAWQKATMGIGEPLMARFLGHLGHPRLATPYHWEGNGKANRILVADQPYTRTVGQLWAYCGLGDPARKRRKAMLVEDALAAGSPKLKSLAYLMAEKCMMQRQSPYRAIYDNRRAVTAQAPAGAILVATARSKPSPPLPVIPPREWTPGHQHADALRVTAKAILKDLWRASA